MNVSDGYLDDNLYFMIDKAQFHLRGCINSQNTRYWSTTNAKEHVEISLHDKNINVWFTVSSKQKVRPLFSIKTVISEVYATELNYCKHSQRS